MKSVAAEEEKKHKNNASYEMITGNYPELLCSHRHLHMCFQNPQRIRRKNKESILTLYCM